jgi:TRAP-type C4-dicarboxylate transport system permease small subunit
MGAKLERVIVALGVFFIVTIFVLTVMQVLMRYGFGQTFFFTEELARYFLVWATLAGMAVETRRNGHIAIPIISDQLPPHFQKALRTILDIFVLLMFMLLVWLGVKSTIFNHGQESPGMQMPLSIPFVAIPLFFAVATFFVLERLWQRRRSVP